jgi:hypothetical protein
MIAREEEDIAILRDGVFVHEASAFSAPLRETKNDRLDDKEQALPHNWNLCRQITDYK